MVPLIDDLEVGICWGSLQAVSLPELIEAAARHGFPTISVRPDQVDVTMAAGLDAPALRRRLVDAGVRVAVIDAISPSPSDQLIPDRDPVWSADAEEACWRAAEILEAPTVALNHYRGRPVSREQLVDAIGAVVRRAGAQGLHVVLEFIPDTGLPSLVETQRVVDAVAEKNCSVLLDTWHHARSGGTIDDIGALPPRAIGSLQLNDRIAPTPGTPYIPMSGRSLPGEGELPLAELVSAAVANSPEITAEVEVFNDELRSLSVDAAAARVAAAVTAWRAGSEHELSQRLERDRVVGLDDQRAHG